jgi:hypothetical protein
VLDTFLEWVCHCFLVKKKDQELLEKVFCVLFLFLFFISFFIGEDYIVSFGTVVTGILDMRPRKHDLHFLVGAKLLPHAFVNIPDEKMHIAVFIFVFVIYFVFFFFYY